MFFSNLEIILETKLENFIMNNSTSYLMSILCKSFTNKYIIMVKKVIDKIMINMIKLKKKKKNSL